MKIRDYFYTLIEAANELHVERRTMWRWIKSERVEAQRIGNITFIEKSEVERLKASLLVQDGD